MPDADLRERDPEVAQLAAALLAPLDGAGRAVVERAFLMADRAHTGQFRDEGAPYIVHPLRVALTLIEHGHRDVELLAAALLHDTLEDTDLSESDISAAFSEHVALLVRTVTRPPRHVPDRAVIYHRQLADGPPAARVLKLADRLDNLMFLHLSPKPGKAQRYLLETEREVLPLARRAGGSLSAALLARWQAVSAQLGATPELAGPEDAAS